jgi:hypothetical protein
MSTRIETSLVYTVGQREVTIKVMSAVGPEDVYENMAKAVMHRYATGEDVLTHAPREVKDFILRTNLNV